MKLLSELIFFPDTIFKLNLFYKKSMIDDCIIYEVGKRRLVDNFTTRIIYQEGCTFEFTSCGVVIFTDTTTREFECYPYNFDYHDVIDYFLEHEEITVEDLLFM